MRQGKYSPKHYFQTRKKTYDHQLSLKLKGILSIIVDKKNQITLQKKFQHTKSKNGPNKPTLKQQGHDALKL